jgi:hypothetical protein
VQYCCALALPFGAIIALTRHRAARRLVNLVNENGAPEEIRTPDPQIRSLNPNFDPAAKNRKPRQIRPECDQWVSTPNANRANGGGGPVGFEKRGRAPTATERPDRKSILQKQNAKRGIRKHSFTVTDSTALAGHIIQQTGSRFEALAPDSRKIGIFKSLREAMAAIRPAHEADHA